MIIIASSLATFKLKVPLKSVVVPLFVPFSRIDAPGKGPTRSLTVPVIVFCCAIEMPQKISVKHNVKINFLFILF